jgi:hypothetical protein
VAQTGPGRGYNCVNKTDTLNGSGETTVERTPVSSSNIASIGYDEDNQILEIEFNDGSVYQYSGVPSSEHDGIMNADSKGKYLHANIKKRYSFVKL